MDNTFTTPALEAVHARQIEDRRAINGMLAKVYVDGHDLLLLFEDGRWARYEVDSGYEAGDESLMFSQERVDALTLADAGLLSRADYQEYKAGYKAHQDEQARRRELAQLAALRAKYEPA